jgi:hypothetical protein
MDLVMQFERFALRLRQTHFEELAIVPMAIAGFSGS